MPFPSLNDVPNLAQGWTVALSVATQLKAQCNALAAACQAGPVSAQQIVAFPAYLYSCQSQFNTVAGLTGIAAYAQEQIGNASVNIPSVFSAMQTAITSTIAWVLANFPKDGNGNLLYVQFNASGQLVFTNFTPAQLAGFVTVLQALSATID